MKTGSLTILPLYFIKIYLWLLGALFIPFELFVTDEYILQGVSGATLA